VPIGDVPESGDVRAELAHMHCMRLMLEWDRNNLRKIRAHGIEREEAEQALANNCDRRSVRR
jgi:hypothetical protein